MDTSPTGKNTRRGPGFRITALSHITIFTALLVAILVFVEAQLPASRAMPLPASTSPIHAGNVAALPALPTTAPLPTASPTPPQPVAMATPLPQPTPSFARRIGILAGHWGYDSGAVCANGLREVDITTDIARRVADQLRALGYEVEILQEQPPDTPQPPLQGFLAAAFVSLHVDSCIPGASGYKVSRWAYSQIPAVEDRLVQCLYREYAKATGLPRHDDSITINMWNYYAFREIGEPTPGAIIEMGFMTDDRWLLVGYPDRAAQGVVNGLRCFLEETP